jgi:hypothetical protein
MELTPKQIEEYLDNKWHDLEKGQKYLLTASRGSFTHFPKSPGVYCIWEEGKICYVGETSGLSGRMRDLTRTVNHTFRRKVGRSNFSNISGYETATNSKKFPTHIEDKIDDFITSKMKISFLPLTLGRKELEEYICRNNNPKYNSPVKRRHNK